MPHDENVVENPYPHVEGTMRSKKDSCVTRILSPISLKPRDRALGMLRDENECCGNMTCAHVDGAMRSMKDRCATRDAHTIGLRPADEVIDDQNQRWNKKYARVDGAMHSETLTNVTCTLDRPTTQRRSAPVMLHDEKEHYMEARSAYNSAWCEGML